MSAGPMLKRSGTACSAAARSTRHLSGLAAAVHRCRRSPRSAGRRADEPHRSRSARTVRTDIAGHAARAAGARLRHPARRVRARPGAHRRGAGVGRHPRSAARRRREPAVFPLPAPDQHCHRRLPDGARRASRCAAAAPVRADRVLREPARPRARAGRRHHDQWCPRVDPARRGIRAAAVGVHEARPRSSAWPCCSPNAPRNATTTGRRPPATSCSRSALIAVPLGADHAAARPRLGDGARLRRLRRAGRRRGARPAGRSVASSSGSWPPYLAVRAGVLQDYQLERFTAFTHPERDVQGTAYNITQAHIAVANGGLFGTGLFHGPQTNGGFVPEQQTDFIFSVAGEEFGLVGGGGDHRAVRRAVLARAAHRPRTPTTPAGSSPSASCAGSRSRRSRTSA